MFGASKQSILTKANPLQGQSTWSNQVFKGTELILHDLFRTCSLFEPATIPLQALGFDCCTTSDSLRVNLLLWSILECCQVSGAVCVGGESVCRCVMRGRKCWELYFRKTWSGSRNTLTERSGLDLFTSTLVEHQVHTKMTTLHISRHSTPKYTAAAVNSANCVCARNAVYGKGPLNSHDLIIESPFNLATTLSLRSFSLYICLAVCGDCPLQRHSGKCDVFCLDSKHVVPFWLPFSSETPNCRFETDRGCSVRCYCPRVFLPNLHLHTFFCGSGIYIVVASNARTFFKVPMQS